MVIVPRQERIHPLQAEDGRLKGGLAAKQPRHFPEGKASGQHPLHIGHQEPQAEVAAQGLDQFPLPRSPGTTAEQHQTALLRSVRRKVGMDQMPGPFPVTIFDRRYRAAGVGPDQADRVGQVRVRLGVPQHVTGNPIIEHELARGKGNGSVRGIMNELYETVLCQRSPGIEDGAGSHPLPEGGAEEVEDQPDAGPLARHVIVEIGEELFVLQVQFGGKADEEALLLKGGKVKRAGKIGKGEGCPHSECGRAAVRNLGRQVGQFTATLRRSSGSSSGIARKQTVDLVVREDEPPQLPEGVGSSPVPAVEPVTDEEVEPPEFVLHMLQTVGIGAGGGYISVQLCRPWHTGPRHCSDMHVQSCFGCGARGAVPLRCNRCPGRPCPGQPYRLLSKDT